MLRYQAQRGDHNPTCNWGTLWAHVTLRDVDVVYRTVFRSVGCNVRYQLSRLLTRQTLVGTVHRSALGMVTCVVASGARY